MEKQFKGKFIIRYMHLALLFLLLGAFLLLASILSQAFGYGFISLILIIIGIGIIYSSKTNNLIFYDDGIYKNNKIILKYEEIKNAKVEEYYHWEKISSILVNLIIWGIFAFLIGNSHRVIKITFRDFEEYRIYDYRYNGFDEMVKILSKYEKEV